MMVAYWVLRKAAMLVNHLAVEWVVYSADSLADEMVSTLVEQKVVGKDNLMVVHWVSAMAALLVDEMVVVLVA